jgi:tetratricopeptide (TPR) repeat protein
MVHMAGHIFHRVGRYADSARVFAQARAIEESDAKALSVTPFQVNWNYGHNRSFLSATLAESGRVQDAIEAAGSQTWAKLDVYWRIGDWDQLANQAVKSFGAASESANVLFFQGMNHAAHKRWIEARSTLDRLNAAFEMRAKETTPEKFHTQLRIHDTMRHELLGAVLMLEGKTEEGIAAFERAVALFARIEYSEPEEYGRPPHINYGNCLLQAGRPEAAIDAFQRGFAWRRNSHWIRKGIEASEIQILRS